MKDIKTQVENISLICKILIASISTSVKLLKQVQWSYMYFTYVEIDVHCKRNRIHCSVDGEDPVFYCNKMKIDVEHLNICVSLTLTIYLTNL